MTSLEIAPRNTHSGLVCMSKYRLYARALRPLQMRQLYMTLL